MEESTATTCISEEYNNCDSKEFIKRVFNGTIKLPYKRSYTSDQAIREKYAKLKQFTAEEFASREITDTPYTLANTNFKSHELLYTDESGAQQLLLKSKNTDYTDTGAISDMFQEHNRLKARYFGAKYSPHDLFYNFPELLAADCEKTYSGIITPYNIREALYWQSNECSAFNPLVLLYFIKKYNAKSVFDFCAGWGDRLIGAMAADIRYVGIDPNSDLFPGYEAIKQFFLPAEKHVRYTLINSTIQTAALPKINSAPEMFDLIFTSPPYFNMEEYVGDGRVYEETEDEWLWNFLWPAIEISLRRLNPGGHFALNLNQQSKQTYLRKLISFMGNKPELKYLGVISYTDARVTNPQPVWIWRKQIQMLPSDAKESKISSHPITPHAKETK